MALYKCNAKADKTLNLFEHNCYKTFTLAWIKQMPRQGKGEIARISGRLKVHPSRLSQILHGPHELTLEQAAEFVDYLGLSELEAEFFLNLVQLARAGTEKLRSRLERSLQE